MAKKFGLLELDLPTEKEEIGYANRLGTANKREV